MHGETDISATEVRDALREVPLFDSLDDGFIELIARLARVRTVGRNEVLFEQGEEGRELIVLLSGLLRVRAHTAEQHEDITLTVVVPGEVLGEMALLDGGVRSASVDAIEDSVVVTISRDVFTRLLREEPELSLAVMRSLVQRLRHTTEHVSDIAYLDLLRRLSKVLRQMAREHGESVAGGTRIKVPLSLQILSGLVAARPQGVERLVTMLEKDGILSHTQDVIVIHDMERLETGTVSITTV